MIEGLYAAASGMIANEERMAVISNNVANASTPGFRRQSAVQNGFYEVLLSRLRHPTALNQDPGPGGGLRTIETFTDVRGGPVTATGNPLNLALTGPGYLAVETPQGERFTRNGHFTIDADGELATSEGYKLQSEGGGGVNVSGGAVSISRDGAVSVDGEPVGRLRLVEFQDPHMLSREGHNLYYASDAAMQRSAQGVNTTVEGAALEMSNVQVPYEMAQMTLGLRAYAANQRVINAFDETMGRLINEVGAPT
ncbi:MAG: flagellar hook-basal body protein [bacterium]|nr:flagellar hook-basal body protein [bacterium]